MKKLLKYALAFFATTMTVSVMAGCTGILPENLTDYNYKTSRPSAEVTLDPAVIEKDKMSAYCGAYISSQKNDFFEYSVYSNGIQIDKAAENNKTADMEIPSAINGTPVIGIAPKAFCDNTEIKSVTVPGTVKYIGEAAFRRCSNLASVVLSDGLKHVGSKTFDGCSSLESVVFPESVVFIGEYVCSLSGVKNISIPGLISEVPIGMYYGSAIEEFVLPKHVTLIKESAFEKCDGLINITVPGNVLEIERTVFANNVNLKNVIIEEGCTELGYAVFEGDIVLETVKFPESLIQFLPSLFPDCNDDLVLYVKEGSKTEEYAINYKYDYISEK